MATINLLPWRELAREENKKKFFVGLIGVGVIALLLMLLVHVVMDYKINSQKQRNNFLRNQVSVLAAKLKLIQGYQKQKESLIMRMNIIQELQANRPLLVHFFDELVDALPQGIYLEKVTRIRTKIILQGFADSNTNVSSLMRHIDVSPWMKKSSLSEIKTGKIKGKDVSEFNVELSLINTHKRI